MILLTPARLAAAAVLALALPAQAQDRAWEAVASETAPTARHENAFTEVGGKLYLLGGRGERPMEAFDPAAGVWTTRAAPPLELHHVQAIAFDGKLLIVNALTGGFPEETPLDRVLVYDPATDRWSDGPAIPAERRRGAGGAVVHDGLIYIVGGNSRGHMSGYVPWLDVLDPATGQWTALADAPHARDHFHAAVIDGRIYAAGGRRSSHDTGEGMNLTVGPVDVYDIASGRWTTLDQPIPTQRAGAATVAVDGELLVMGGESVAQVAAHAEVERLDPATGRWTRETPLPQGRHGTQAVVLDDLVWIAAGSGNRGGGPELNDLLVAR